MNNFNFIGFVKMMVLVSIPALIYSFAHLGFYEGMISFAWGIAYISSLYPVMLSCKSLDEIKSVKLTDGQRNFIGILVFFVTILGVISISEMFIKEEYANSEGLMGLLGIISFAASSYIYRVLALSTGISVLKITKAQNI